MRNILGGVFGVIFVGLAILMFINSPQPGIYLVSGPQTFSSALWEYRSLDVFLQMLIILAGTFSILTLVGRSQQ